MSFLVFQVTAFPEVYQPECNIYNFFSPSELLPLFHDATTTRRHNPEGPNIHIHCCVIFKSYKNKFAKLPSNMFIRFQNVSGISHPGASTRFRAMASPYEASWSHLLDTPHSVGLLHTSDQPDAETCTWLHTTITTNILTPDGIRTHNPSKRPVANPCLSPRGHWDRQLAYIKYFGAAACGQRVTVVLCAVP
jgi:hypothetical protein